MNNVNISRNPFGPLSCLIVAILNITVLYGFYKYPLRGQMQRMMFTSDGRPFNPPSVDDDNLYNSPGFSDFKSDGFKKYLAQRWISGPSRKNNNVTYGHRSQAGQSQFVDQLLDRRRGGFFVECGAGTGIEISNTIFFETDRNWNGLLVEANPAYYKEIQEKERKSYSINACLSTTAYIMRVIFSPNGVLGGIRQGNARRNGDIDVTCFPLHAMLYALDVKHVDYFSLDVEGVELEILGTIPFHEIIIDVISIEYFIWHNAKATLDKLKKIRIFFENTGVYREVGILHLKKKKNTEANGLDVIFQRMAD